MKRLSKSLKYHFYYLPPYHYRNDKRGNDDCSTLSLPKTRFGNDDLEISPLPHF